MIDRKIPTLFDCSVDNRHVEIANALINLNNVDYNVNPNVNIIWKRTFDMLVHVYCTQFKNVGFNMAFDVFKIMVRRSVFRSLKTCNFLMSSLVWVGELERSFEVFEFMREEGVHLDVYSYSVVINACLSGRVKDGVELFLEMERVGIMPNTVTYNNVIHGLCRCGDLDEAFRFIHVVMYGGLINGLLKFEKFEEANHLLEKMLKNNIVANEAVFN